MGENKETGYREGQEVFLIYLEDNNQPVSAYVHIVKIEEGLITFRTNKNIVSIPVSRIIKIKQKSENEN